MVSQISIFAENKKGAVRAITRILSDADINIQSFVTNDSAEFGIIRMLVPGAEKAGTLLTAAGYAVGEARDGRHALAEALAGRWELVISDVDMPRMDGISFCRAYREAGGGAKIVLLTYKDDEATKRAAADAGAAGLWSKARLAEPKAFLAALADAIPPRAD